MRAPFAWAYFARGHIANDNEYICIDACESSKTSTKNTPDTLVTKLLPQKLKCKYFTIQGELNHMPLFYILKI